MLKDIYKFVRFIIEWYLILVFVYVFIKWGGLIEVVFKIVFNLTSFWWGFCRLLVLIDEMFICEYFNMVIMLVVFYVYKGLNKKKWILGKIEGF